MADTNVNSKLNKNIGDIPKDTPMFSPSVDVDLVNVNITDKIKEIATAIANSTNSQIAHDKHVLSLTISAVSDEFASLLAEKINSSKSDKPAKDILPAALLDEGFTLFNSSIFSELNRHTAEHLVELRSKTVAFIDKQVNLTVMSVVTKIISQQTAITNKFTDASKNIIKVVTDATNNLSEEHKNALKYKEFTGHIFQRIALEVADKKKRKAKRKAQLKKEWAGAFTKLITPTTWLDNVKETFSEIGKEFAKTHDYIFGAEGNREKRQKLKQAKIDLKVNVDLQQQQLKLDAANLKKLSKNVFTTIKTLHDETADILTDLELVAKQNEKDETYEARQQLDKPDTAQNVKASVDVDTSAGNILVALCGVALFATIAVGVYKAWPMMRRGLKLSKQPSLGDAPVFADVKGFEPVPNNDSQQADVDDDVDKLEAALDADFKEADDKLTTAINDTATKLDSDGKQAYTEVIDELNETSNATAATLSVAIDDAVSASQHILPIAQETDTDNTTRTVNKQANTLSTDDMYDTAVEPSDEQDDEKIAPEGVDPSDIATRIIGEDEGLEQRINAIEEQNSEEKITEKLQDDEDAVILKEELPVALQELKTAINSFDKNIPSRLEKVNEQIDKANKLFVETADALQKQHLELGNNVHITTIDPADYKSGGWLSTHPFRQMADSINSTITDGTKAFNAHEKQIKTLKSLEQRLNAAIDDNMADKPEYLLVNTAELHELNTSIDHLATDIFTPTFNIMINTTIENADKPKRLKETLTRHSATNQTASYSAYSNVSV